MEAALSAVKGLLPEAVKQQLQQAIDGGLVPRSAAQHVPPELLTPEGLVVALFTAFFGFILLLLVLGPRGKKRGSTVVLTGPPNSGKTTLFFQLKDGSLHNGVVASMGDNAATVALRPARGAPKTAQLLDVPGHHSARHHLEAVLKDAAAIVFLVDAVEVTPHRTEAADMLYEVLTHSAVHRSRTPLLIACNKMDLEMEAHSVDFIRKTLERQLDAMRKTRAASIGKDAGGGGGAALGPAERPFSFAALRSKVALAPAAAKTGSLEEVVAFIAANV
ncbi:hypothetical protein MNEG_10881 [Monoraphidium neglectum]|jgi:signal recognition particle receptor subunit beta|uniref:Signal recognition particle receptor subunit beta n=1 Tax=Monoraphidium neglectum TaxID=145388 RepID=A0A0D2JBF5_9CHLO|nr:hypothetical protein MNEG_10881 [Monoraphidium neglectum]KIY97082.1 hypothetical protein MNEG_10881 [Monoraphidium neglectum]|eukprot:XP_013896102.1 hypothetical protein MNEG_10881 [Monoraphidium neglectum]